MGEGGILRETPQRPPHPPWPSPGGPGPRGPRPGSALPGEAEPTDTTPARCSPLSPCQPQPLEPQGSSDISAFASVSPKLFRPHSVSPHSLGFPAKPGRAQAGTSIRLLPALMEQLLGPRPVWTWQRERRRAPLGSQATSTSPSLATALLRRGGGGRVGRTHGVQRPVRDFPTSALLTWPGTQSPLPPRIDRCPAGPALSPCPALLPSSGCLLHPRRSPHFFAWGSLSRAGTYGQHLSVASLRFKVPSQESPQRLWTSAAPVFHMLGN